MSVKDLKIGEILLCDGLEGINIVLKCSTNFIASAEISKLPATDGVWYFNRLIVPKQFRNLGYAKKLLTKLVSVCKEKKINLMCDINPYGDLDFNQLHKLYSSFGFVDVEGEGYMMLYN